MVIELSHNVGLPPSTMVTINSPVAIEISYLDHMKSSYSFGVELFYV